jgi:hypothetical protein
VVSVSMWVGARCVCAWGVHIARACKHAYCICMCAESK